MYQPRAPRLATRKWRCRAHAGVVGYEPRSAVLAVVDAPWELRDAKTWACEVAKCIRWRNFRQPPRTRDRPPTPDLFDIVFREGRDRERVLRVGWVARRELDGRRWQG